MWDPSAITGSLFLKDTDTAAAKLTPACWEGKKANILFNDAPSIF